MAFTYGFYNYNENDDQDDLKIYDAVQVSQLFDGLIEDGVYAHIGNKYAVSPSKDANENIIDNEVIVDTGRSWFNHTWNYVDAPLIVSAPAPETVNKRIDALVIDINNTSRHNEILWVKGTPDASAPVKPTLINDGSHFQHPIAYVTRLGNTPKIAAQYIENAVGVDSLTPYVTGVLESVTVENLVAQMEASLNAWMATKESEVNAWFLEQQDDFDDWFQDMKDQLSTDAAGRLQNEIDSITITQSGTASSSTTRSSYLSINNTNIAKIPGSSYMERSDYVVAGDSANVTFVNSEITANSAISVFFDDPEVYYTSRTVSSGSCTINYRNNTGSSKTITTRIVIG